MRDFNLGKSKGEGSRGKEEEGKEEKEARRRHRNETAFLVESRDESLQLGQVKGEEKEDIQAKRQRLFREGGGQRQERSEGDVRRKRKASKERTEGKKTHVVSASSES
jgi:hypothetical protein